MSPVANMPITVVATDRVRRQVRLHPAIERKFDFGEVMDSPRFAAVARKMPCASTNGGDNKTRDWLERLPSRRAS